jgi:UPF0176 protein
MSHFHIASFYFFKKIKQDELLSIRAWLMGKADLKRILGLMILGTEGLNVTVTSKNAESLNLFIKEVLFFFSEKNVSIKKSKSQKPPFRKFVVKIREEIVTIGDPKIVPSGNKQHLTPDQWHQMLESDDVVVIDTRNDYEVEIGTFRNAIDLKMKEFSEFSEKMKNFKSEKEKPHLIFCTGGIRCEKAIFAMEELGYKNVYQLEGGILNYMEQYPQGQFDGECFVFDSRVALNKDLDPSQVYSLCPQCGEVGSIDIECKKCDEPTKLCKKCFALTNEKPEFYTCSKNCRHHYLRSPNKKGPQQKQFYHGS